jgi:hypothetical protein
MNLSSNSFRYKCLYIFRSKSSRIERFLHLRGYRRFSADQQRLSLFTKTSTHARNFLIRQTKRTDARAGGVVPVVGEPNAMVVAAGVPRVDIDDVEFW